MRSIVFILALLTAAPVRAEGYLPPVTDPLVKAECGECHLAFPAASLPARSWNRVMDGLGDHFGEKLAIAPATATAIRAYLIARSADYGRSKFTRDLAADAAPLRLTQTPYFLRKHRFSDSVWQRPDVVTKSNCLACHLGAASGLYDDD